MAEPRSEKEAPAGHRKRLREKFIKSGLSGFHDYEIVELLLTLGSPRKDCKPQAKAAIKRFGSLRGVLSASAEELQRIEGIGPRNALGIKLVSEVAREFLKQKIVDKRVIAICLFEQLLNLLSKLTAVRIQHNKFTQTPFGQHFICPILGTDKITQLTCPDLQLIKF